MNLLLMWKILVLIGSALVVLNLLKRENIRNKDELLVTMLAFCLIFLIEVWYFWILIFVLLCIYLYKRGMFS